VLGFSDHPDGYVSKNDTVLGYAVNINCISLGVLWGSGEGRVETVLGSVRMELHGGLI